MMAMNSGLQWSTAVKPLLSASYSSFNKQDLPEFTRAIINSEKEILTHEDDYEPFYSSFVALASHFISASASNLSKTTLNQTTAACRVLLQFLLQRLNTRDEGCTISPKYLVILIKGLCKGGPCLPKSDVVTFSSMLKAARCPPHVKDRETPDAPTEQKEAKQRPRLDTGSNLFNRLTAVFDEVPSSPGGKVEGSVETINTEGDSTVVHIPDPAEELVAMFGRKNLAALLQLDGANVLLDSSLRLSFLSKYVQRYQDAVAGTAFLMPATLSEALTTRTSYTHLLSDISIVWRSFSLPVLEPLTPERLEKMVRVTMSCLYASITVAVSNTIINMMKAPASQPGQGKEEEMEGCGTSIVQKTLEIFNMVSSALRNSTRAGGNVCQNLNLLGSWLLLKGLQGILSLNPATILERKDSSKSRAGEGGKPREAAPSSAAAGRPSSGKRSSLSSVVQGFGVVSVALGNQALQLFTSLLEDLQIEGPAKNLQPSATEATQGIEVEMTSSMPAVARVRKLLGSVPLTDLLFNLVSVSFKRASQLNRMKQGSETPETSSSSTSDSNTYYEDDFSSSQDTSEEEDDDSEPILGHWFAETLSPNEGRSSTSSSPPPTRVEGGSGGDGKQRGHHSSDSDSPNFIPDKREPTGFVALATGVLNFMHTYFINSPDKEFRSLMTSTLGGEHATSLATLVRELDKECSRMASDKVYEELSIALARFNHSLIANECMPEKLQDFLLAILGVYPECDEPWNLTLHPRTLAVLAEVLLLRQQRERESARLSSGCSDSAVIAIWKRFLSTLKSVVMNLHGKADHQDDVNVEHVQLLLFLFHSLQLQKKKFVLQMLGHTIVSIATTHARLEESVPLPLSRLMLVFEYLLHYFYDPPPQLMDQVQWNLFTVHTLNAGSAEREGRPVSKACQFFPCREVQENFRKHLSTQEAAEVGLMKPRFYYLGPADTSTHDAPKLDGLATNVIMNNGEFFTYNQLYSACITLLMAGSRCDKTREKLTLLDSSAMHYHFLIMWRLLACLPPSLAYLQLLERREVKLSNSEVLHTLRWAPRLGVKPFTAWIKDYLVKQGQTAQQAETLVSSANKACNTTEFDVQMAMHFIRHQIVDLPMVGPHEILAPSKLPGLSSILMLDAVVAKVSVSLNNLFPKLTAEGDADKAADLAQDLIPATFHLIEAYSVFVRSSVLGDVARTDETTLTPQRLRAFATVMSVGSGQASRAAALGSSLLAMLPSSVRSAIDKWTSASGSEFPSISAWKNAFANDLIPCETYMDAIHSAHMVSLSGQSPFNINASMRHVLTSLMRFITDLLGWVPNSSTSREYVRVMFPLLYDVNMQYLYEQVTSILVKFLGEADGEPFLQKMYEHLYSVCHDLIVNYSDTESGLDEKIFHECLKFMENNLEKTAAKKACEVFYTDQADLTTLLLTAARENLSHQFSARVLKFFNRLFQLAEKSPGDRSYEALCRQLCRLSSVEQSVLQALLTKMTTSQAGAAGDEEEGGSSSSSSSPKENRYLLLCLVQAMVKEKSPVYEEVALSLLQALMPMGGPLLAAVRGEMLDFPELMVIMQTLAGAGRGQGHLHLFKSAAAWLQLCKTHVSQKDVLEKVLTDGKAGKGMLETLCCLLSYVGEILGALKRTSDRAGSASPPPDCDGAGHQDPESDWAEDMGQDDDDSGGEDSDEESLNNKLCTFTITQKEFMNQHWYHCHTCKMIDGVGVCTVCAKVCHKDHDLTYAKFGSFFCDCGAKEDGSCKALVKRTPQSGLDYSGNASQSAFAMDAVHPSSLRRRLSTPGQEDRGAESSKTADLLNKHREALARQIESYKTELLAHLESSRTVATVVEMLELIVPRLTESYQDLSPSGSSSRAQRALHQLHTLAKKVEVTSDQLMTVTLGSQEGAFENVRINFSGEQGQQIRQLITAHMLRRVAMCVLSSPHGKRQHLAVSHEKGKITILQLSALLKQADSSKKKLTLTRLSAAPIPFTVLSITGNPCNEDFLAVCGLKDCHVLTFTSSGSVADHLVLHPSLATGNFIIKAVWLPGSQTELAIVTADFVKIYDLSMDALSPMYYFLLPSGKVRDATFIFTEEGRHMVLMSSSGYIYTQAMEEVSSAKHGPFYITNVLEVKHPELKDNNGQVAGGGVSVYYSHALQLLFFSYTQGKSFASPVSKDLWQTTNMFPISFKSSNNGSGGKGGSSSLQPLVHFTEVAGHTGLLYCMAQTSNNPVVLMVKPDTITMQEIKVVPSKAKIQDVVAIRHVASNSDQQRTTMILLCEDGSLRIYMANVDSTDFWLSPYLQPQSPIAVLKPPRKKKASKSGRPSGSVNFPVDFFEHCQQTNDVEFGGNDVLQVYNQQQVKTRLNTTGMYIASTKPTGFSFEITNNSNSSVMVGVRVLVGSQSLERAPSCLEVFGRSIPVTLTRPRWFDLPFTREESLTADKKFTLFVGPSQDPSGVTMVDQIKVYIKTKEVFGWPEETDEFPETSSQKATAVSAGGTTPDTEVLPSAPIPMTTADKLLSCALEVLDGAFATSKTPEDDQDPQRRRTLEMATSLLTLPTPVEVQQYTKSLLASLFPSKTAYHNHKDQAQLGHVMRSLSGEETEMDVEGFQRLVVTARSVAVSRPHNLIKFAERGESLEESVSSKDSGSGTPPTPLSPPVPGGGTCHFMAQLMETFWKLHAAKPPNPMLAPVCLPGLAHVDVTVGALVEIVHAFTMADLDSLHLATSLYLRLLLCPDPAVSFSCRQAMIRVLRPRHRRRRVFIPSPPRCSSPGNGGDDDDDDDDGKGDKSETPPSEQQVLLPDQGQGPGDQDQDPDAELEDQYEVVEGGEPLVLEPGEGNEQPGGAGALQGLEELWDRDPDPGNYPPIVDIPPDADDETMVELAIALSLQDPGLGLARQAQSASSIEEGQLSDTTASAPGSDDEVGSNAATDGSTLRTSPAEHGGSIGSESGGSAVDSISVSGRSSAYGGYQAQEAGGGGGRSETSSVGGAPCGTAGHETTFTIEPDHDYDTSCRLHSLRLLLLEKLLEHLPQIREFGGVRAIPFMQVVLMLTSDLDSEEDKERAALDHLLQTVLAQLDLQAKDLDKMATRSKAFEVKLILLRLLSVLLSRSRSSSKSSADASTFLSSSTATALISSNAIGYCLQVLQGLLPFWKQFSSQEAEGGSTPATLLRPHPSCPPPDMSPFFMRQYVKSHANDVFEDYPQLLTEMVLRLPYQLKKIADSVQTVPAAVFDLQWHNILSEYMMTQQTPFVKKQVRKLLLFICGSKDRYRQLRDQHAIQSHLSAVVEMCQTGGLDISLPVPGPHSLSLPYDTLLAMIEHLKICSEVASSRPHNWQTYCEQNQKMLSFLVKASIVLDEGVAPTLLQLLQAAICGPKTSASSSSTPSTGSAGTAAAPAAAAAAAPTTAAAAGSTSAASPSRHRRDKAESKVKDHRDRRDKKKRKGKEEESPKPDEALCITLVKLLNRVLDSELFVKFVRTFLLESNSSGNRWLAHSLVLQIYRHSSQEQQEAMLDEMWALWSELPAHGRKVAQFVDLLGYFVLKTPDLSDQKVKEYLGKAVEVLREENCVLSNHPNATIYNMLQGLVDFDGYYLESDPCLVCNNPEVPFSCLKLSAIKLDSKFTTSTQIVKLVGSHTISKITLRISDLKRTKMVKTLNIYYNNRSVQAVVELRNRPGLWHKAKKVTLAAGQVDVKVEFPIPIVACNLMIEYAEFYDNLQATAETLQCPRCSASVPANPGVCGNCGENVYQCHKCRAINYDEKDPFLCNACGFCKYAKFDFTLNAKPCCAVDPIENEEDRRKAISTINSLLEKADKIYKQLQTQRPLLENLLYQVAEHSSEKLGTREGGAGTSTVSASSVNKAIQMLAQKYCGECKSNFDELSKIIQKVLASRRELVEYDRQQREAAATGHPPPSIFSASARAGEAPPPSAASVASSSTSSSSSSSSAATAVPAEKTSSTVARQRKVESKGGNCYGCASAAVEHCITLLRALVTNCSMRQVLCTQGMIQELIDYNLRHGTLAVRNEVRRLLCLLTKDNRRGTEEMNNLIMTRITSAIRGHQANPDLGSSVRHELMLLAASLHQEDSCWEQRVRCVMKLFLMGMHLKSPVIMDSITLPCLRILQDIVRHDSPASKKKETPEVEIAENLLPATFHMDVRQWLAGDPRYSFSNWRKRLPHRAPQNADEERREADRRAVRALYLQEKYALRWKQRLWKTPAVQLRLTQTTWLKTAMFSPSSRSARQTACSIIEAIAQVPARRKEVIDMLTGCLDDVGNSGECASEFLELYKRLIQPDHWKIYLAIKGLLPRLGNLITTEVEHLEYLEETTLSSDLAQGFALKALTELLSLFVEQPTLKPRYKSRLVGYILNGYLSLRKLLVQRTKLVDDTQDKLLELLEELTTGTAAETREFMAVCVKTVKKYPLDDYRSPVFIFERLCSIIYPEENDVGEFYVILEKDPQQEDFLQGRMLGNPYSSSEPGMGPLMRDIKNKICQDCELVALLEDDTGMELLVNKKIISLDLPVKEVYKKIWLPEHGEGEPMPIIYRMRGLLGDATEDMVNSLDTSNEEDIDKEEVFKMASVLSECGGLQVMLQRLASIKDLTLGKQLMMVLLKLFGFALNVKANRQDLIRPELNTVGIMLGALNLALWAEQEAGASVNKGQTITEQILQIMEMIFLEASQQSPEVYTRFSKLCGDKHQLMTLLDRINSPFVRANPSVLQALMRLIPFLAFGEEDKMLALINHFKPYLHFARFDVEHSQDEQVHLDCFCVIANGIENNANGRKLKDMMNEHGVVAKAVSYILENAPEIKTLLATDSEVWKEFLGKPALGYVLRLLRGLCMGHVPTQNKIAEGCIPILHKLEQVSSDKHIGTMSENLLDTLKENQEAAKKIEEIRKQTRAEKKRLAMAVRKKQLGALGMTTNDKGQVTVKSSVLKQMEELKEETGLVCCICREGYKYQPQKVLAVYTFTKRANLDEFENKSRKTVGYSTVSHFNIIHVDCHTAAVRHNRGREEWDSAALQNANTKCNGLLPLWGPQVAESVFANCLARHNNYLSECTGIRDPSYHLTLHDIKLNLLRFAQERSFSEDSGGGGRQSNMHLLPYMMHMALYVINSTRCQSREEKSVFTFLEMPKERWIENSFETEGAFYYPVLALHVLGLDKWKEIRARVADRILVTAHVRAVCQPGAKTVSDKSVQDYNTYRYGLVFFGLVNCFYEKIIRKVVVSSAEGGQTSALADFIRQNDRQVLELCDRLLAAYEEELLPCESLSEFYDVTGLLEDVSNPEEHLASLLSGLP